MSKFFYNGRLVEVKESRVLQVCDDGSRYELTVQSEKFRNCGNSVYYLPKQNLKKVPEVSDALTTYEVASEVVGCDINNEPQYRSSGLSEVQ